MEKKEREAYAAFVLVKTAQICKPFSIDWLKDRPDLQVGNFGIEVTRAIDTQDAEQSKLDSEVLACQTYEAAHEKISKLKKPEKYRSEPRQLPGSNRFSLLSGGGYDDAKPLKLIVHAIERKNRKFIKYPDYERFSQRGLYIFDDEIRPSGHPLSVESILKPMKDSVFDVVFIHQNNKLIVVDKSNEMLHEYAFGKLDRINAMCEAKRAVDSPDYEIFIERAKEYRESIGDKECY